MESAMGHWESNSGQFAGSSYISEDPEELAVRQAPVASPRPPSSGSGSVTPLPTSRSAAPSSVGPASPAPPVPGLAGEERLAQVRELIFGNEMRTYEGRFAEMEERLITRMATLQSEIVRELATVRQSLEPRIATLEREMEGRSDLVERAVDTARETAEARVREMRMEFIGYRKTLEQTISQLEDRVAKGGRQITQELVELRNQTAQRMAEVSTDFDRRVGTVEGRMTDRETLVRGLADLARGLVGQDSQR